MTLFHYSKQIRNQKLAFYGTSKIMSLSNIFHLGCWRLRRSIRAVTSTNEASRAFYFTHSEGEPHPSPHEQVDAALFAPPLLTARPISG